MSGAAPLPEAVEVPVPSTWECPLFGTYGLCRGSVSGEVPESSWSATTGVPTGRRRQRCAGKTAWEDPGRDTLTQPPARDDRPGPPEAGRGREGLSPERGSAALQTPDLGLWPPEL